MGFGRKLQEKMDEKGLKQVDVVNAVGIPKTTLSSMLSRDNTKVDIDTFLKICTLLECLPEEFSDEVIQQRQPFENKMTTDEKQLLEYFNSLNDEGKEKALERLEEMSALDRYKKGGKSGVAKEA